MILDAVFPPRCVACGTDGDWYCDACLNAIELVRINHRDEELDGLVIVGYYHDPRLRAAITGLKYHYATCLIPFLSMLLARYKAERQDPWPWAGERSLTLQAVVAAPERVRSRGFDQAELIRDAVKEQIAPWAETHSLLARRSSLKAQADLKPGPLRTANVHGVYHIPYGFSGPMPRAVLLVDDVYTTGATLREAARVLREAGVDHVYGFTLAIGK